jgi:transcriptional regulator with XRE-family HTH domain/rRNA-processing protein FCF1
MGYDYQKMDKLISESGMPKYSFFRQIGISEKTFSRWVGGSDIPKEVTVRKIAERLGVSLADLRTKNDADEPILEPQKKNSSKSTFPDPANTPKSKPDTQYDFSFSSAELDQYRGYSACIIFDTCSIMNAPDLLEFVNGEELVVVPKIVLDELENNKRKFDYNDAGRAAQRAISAIYNYERLYPLIMADDNVKLIPETYRAKNGEPESNDNKILSVAIRHKLYTPLPVVFITNDFSLSLKASGQNITVCSAEEFINGNIPPFPHFDWGNIPKEKQDTDPHEYDPIRRLKEAEEKEDYNKVILYSIILKKVSGLRRYISCQIDAPIKDLAELYISLRTKKDISRNKAKFAEVKAIAAKFLDADDMNALALSFGAAYQDALSSLSGSIKQIAGDLE